MPSVCFFFELHQPYRLRPYHVFDIGSPEYFHPEAEREAVHEACEQSYLPLLEFLSESARERVHEFRCSLSITGTLVEQLRRWRPMTLERIQRLVATGQVEILGETYYHSLATLFSDREFKEQVNMHRDLMETEFGVRPTAFRNTGLIFDHRTARLATLLGFEGMIVPAQLTLLGGRRADHVYHASGLPSLRLLPGGHQFFHRLPRFPAPQPLPCPHDGTAKLRNIFADATDISGHFDIMRRMVYGDMDLRFLTVSECLREGQETEALHHDTVVSWARPDGDLSPWLGNNRQRDAAGELYELEDRVWASGDVGLLQTFRRLQDADHFYSMNTVDGAVVEDGRAYAAPQEAYVHFMNVLQDFRRRLKYGFRPGRGKPARMQVRRPERGL